MGVSVLQGVIYLDEDHCRSYNEKGFLDGRSKTMFGVGIVVTICVLLSIPVTLVLCLIQGAAMIVVRWWFWLVVSAGYVVLCIMGLFIIITFPAAWKDNVDLCDNRGIGDCVSWPRSERQLDFLLSSLIRAPSPLSSAASGSIFYLLSSLASSLAA